MPQPHAGEQKDAYLTRCMASSEARQSFPQQDRRWAVCNSMWRQMHDEKKSLEETVKAIKDAFTKRLTLP